MKLLLSLVIFVIASIAQSTARAEEFPNIAICDSRSINGICTEYDLTRTPANKLKDLSTECTNLFFEINGKVFKGAVFAKGKQCPTEKRVGVCKNYKIPDLDKFTYDKHYYTGTNEYYPWKRGGIEGPCKSVGGTAYFDEH